MIYCLNNKTIECGKSYFQINTRVVGGIPAVPNSWPAQVFIKQNYAGRFYDYLGNIYTVTGGSGFCSGTIIDENTIISSASCIRSTFYYILNGIKYQLFDVTSFYTTLESMFDVYAGINDISNIWNSTSSNTGKLSVKQIILVII